MMAIKTNDPVFHFLPPKIEWIMGSGGVLGIIWKTIYNPIKQKFTTIDPKITKNKKEIIEIKSDLKHIKKDVHLIKEILIKKVITKL